MNFFWLSLKGGTSDFFRYFLPLFKLGGGAVIAVVLINELPPLLLSHYWGHSVPRIVFALTVPIWQTLMHGIYAITLAALIFSVKNGKPLNPWVHFSLYWEQVFVEGLRSYSRAMFWSFLFIIPGLYKMLQYYFVTYVTVFDAEYKSGYVDVMKRSQELLKGHLLGLLLLIAILGAPFLIMDTVFGEPTEISAVSLGKMGLTLVLEVYTQFVLFRGFEIAMEQFKKGSHSGIEI